MEYEIISGMTLQSIMEMISLPHFVMHGLMLLFIVFLLTKRPFRPTRQNDALSKNEEDELIKEWKPIPLAPQMTRMQLRNQSNLVITHSTDTRVTVNGQENVINLARSNYLGLVADKKVNEIAEETIRKYGVGSCGPRGFYGSIDVHLQLEKRIAKFMNMQEAILYSSGYATVSSAIPSFAKMGDIIIADKAISQPLQVGITLSRSRVHYFKHNDIADLTRILDQTMHKGEKGKIARKFLVIEGVYYNTGDIAMLPQIMALKDKYKFRIIMDESHSIGVLGKTGRGITEHYGIDANEVEVITANLSNAFSSGGGFCCGTSAVIFHQRLNGVGYVFSASLPPFLSTAAEAAIDILDENPKRLEALAKNAQTLYTALSDVSGVQVSSSPLSPILHLRLQSKDSRDEIEDTLESIVTQALERGLLLTRAKYVETEKFLPEPSIRICVNSALTEQDMSSIITTIKDILSSTLTTSNKKH
eukprot:gene15374-18236_t